MALSTVWYLGPEDVTPYNGGTCEPSPAPCRLPAVPRCASVPIDRRLLAGVVPCSHKDVRNPRGPDDGIDERAPIPGEFQVSAPAGSVFMQDTRLWHAGAANQSQHERTAIVCRCKSSAAAPFASSSPCEEASKPAAAPDAPWWLSSHEFGNLHSGGQHVKSYVPRDVYQSFSPELQLLYRHVAEGEEDFLQPANQVKARMAGGPYEDELGDNSHLSVLGGGGMGAEEWRRARGRL